MDVGTFAGLVEKKDYAALEAALAGATVAELARAWPKLGAFARLVCFKLLDAARAMELFEALSFSLRYELFAGFPLQAIAPVLESAGPVDRRRFVALPRALYDRMFRSLVAEQAANR